MGVDEQTAPGGRGERNRLSAGSARDPAERLAEEFLERRRRGEKVEVSAYAEKHPELAERIRDLFPTLLALEGLGSQAAGSKASRDVGGVPAKLGEYRLLGEIGRGGMGCVYEAIQESLGRRVALKVLPHRALVRQVDRERFVREAQAAARLQHPNIVPVFGVGEERGVHFYAMQFIHGESLEKVIAELQVLRRASETASGPTESIAERLLSGAFDGAVPAEPRGEEKDAGGAGARPGDRERADPLAPSSSTNLLGSDSAQGGSRQRYFRNVARLGAQAADALALAHREGILHRDVKPSNLLLDAHGKLWVTDFGLAKAEGSDTLTREGDMVGTLAYMAPERLDGWSDPRSDVYGLGVTLYELLTLRPAFEASDRHRLLKKVAEEEPRRPGKLEPRLPRDLETIVLKAIEKDPERRYRSAEALGADLERFLRYEPIEARPPTAAGRVVKWARRRPAAAASVVLVALLLVSVALIGRYAYRVRREADLESYRRLVVEAIAETERGRYGWEAPAVEGETDAIEWVSEEGGALLASLRADGPPVGPDPRRRAVDMLQAAIELFGDRPDAWFQRAKARQLLGDDRGALADLAEALRCDGGFEPATLLRRHIAAGGAGDGEPVEGVGRSTTSSSEAARWVEENRAEVEKSAWARAWEHAFAAVEERAWSEAEGAYEELIELESAAGERYLGESLAIRLNRGRCRQKLGDLPGALEDFSAAADRWPEVMEPVLLQAETWHRLERPDRAERLIDGFHRRAPDPASFALEVATLYGERLRERARGLEWLEKARPGSARELLRASIHMGLGELEQARKAVASALSFDPDAPDALLLDGRIHSALGELREARSTLERAASLAGGDARIHYWLGVVLHGLGEPRRALASLQSASALDPDAASTVFRLAYTLHMLGETKESELAYRRVLELVADQEPAPGGFHFLVHNNLAAGYSKEERYGEALEEGLEALRIDSQSPFVIRNLSFVLGELILELEQTGEAPQESLVESAREVVRLLGERAPEFLALWARVRKAMGYRRDAVVAFEQVIALGRSTSADRQRLEELRGELSPDLSSYESVDAALGSRGRGPEEERALLESFRALEQDPRRLAVGAYLAGRLSEREERYEEAARCFKEAIAAGGPHPTPLVRLLESLDAAGRPEEAVAWLGVFSPVQGMGRHPQVLDLWLRLTLGRLRWKPSEALAGAPAEIPDTAEWQEAVFALQTLAERGDAPIEHERLVAPGGRSTASALYAAALEARSPGLWESLSRCVASGEVSRTPEVDGVGETPFEDVPPEGALLTGFRLTLGGFGGEQVVSSLRPVFLGRTGRFEGVASGAPSAPRVELMARPGYAVGAVGLRKSGRVTGFEVLFLKIREGRAGPGGLLDPEDSYQVRSAGLGGATPLAWLDGGGRAVAGVFGRAGVELHSLGLVVPSRPSWEAGIVGSALSALESIEGGSDERRAILDALVELARSGRRTPLAAALEGYSGGGSEKRFEEAAGAVLDALAVGDPHPGPCLRLARVLYRGGEVEIAESILGHLVAHGGSRDGEVLDLWLRVALGGLGWKPSEMLARFPSDVPWAPEWQEAAFALESLRAAGDAPIERDVFELAVDSRESSALYAAALEARSPGLWRGLSEVVQHGEVARTREVDGAGGGPFDTIPSKGGLLVGFRLVLCIVESREALSAIEPLFLGPSGRSSGARAGKPCPGERWRDVVAPPGYAVGGIALTGGARIHDFQVIFFRIREGELDPAELLEPADSRRNERIGLSEAIEEIVSEGEAVVGLFGRHQNDVDSLGLVLAGSPYEHFRHPRDVDAELGRALRIVPEGGIWRAHEGPDAPAAGWMLSAFDDRAWKAVREGAAAGERGGDRVWLRRVFDVERPGELERPVLFVFAGDDVTVFLNGEKVHEVRLADSETWMPYETGAETVLTGSAWHVLRLALPIPAGVLREGENVLAAEASSRARPRVSLDAHRAPGARTPWLEGFLQTTGEGPKRALATYLEGRLLEERGDLERAIERYEIVRAAPEGWLEPALHIAECHLASGRRKEAESVLRECLGREGLWRDAESLDRLIGLFFRASGRSAAEALGLLEGAPVGVIADSVSDWSGTRAQSTRGWLHGYYSPTADDDGTYQVEDFTPFTDVHWTGTGWLLRQAPGTPHTFTVIEREHTHPHAALSDGGEEYWTIRRWVSDHAGDVAITWHMHKMNSGGNGVGGRLFVEGAEVDSAVISGADATGVSRTITARVSVGSRIDLALTPRGSDGKDSSSNWLVVSTGLPDEAGRGSPTGRVARHPSAGFLAPLRELATTGVLRINCGRLESLDLPSGELWLGDRFYRGGRIGSWGDATTVAVPAVQRFERYYHTREPASITAYQIPLPRGRYRVTLHYAEYAFPEPFMRVFDTYVEGVPVEVNYEPGARGFRSADAHSFETSVQDGVLDLALRARLGAPMIHGIEIRRIGEPVGAASGPVVSSAEAPLPGDADARYFRAGRLHVLGRQLSRRSRREEAVAAFQASAALFRALATEGHRPELCRRGVDVVWPELARVLRGLGRGNEADQVHEYAALYEALENYASVEEALRRPRGADLTLIPEGAYWRYLPGTAPPPAGWNLPGFDDSAWESGQSGFGYGDGDDATVLRMRYRYTTLYLRGSFCVPNLSECRDVTLEMRVDDGCVVYLNGEEVGRVRAGSGGALAHDAVASEIAKEPLETWSLPLPRELLRAENVLAIQGLNSELYSSDFSLTPVVRGTFEYDLLERVRESGFGRERSPVLSYLEACTLQRRGKFQRAATIFEELARGPGDPVEPVVRLCQCLESLGESGRARELLEDLCRRRPEAPLVSWELWSETELAASAVEPADGATLVGPDVVLRVAADLAGEGSFPEVCTRWQVRSASEDYLLNPTFDAVDCDGPPTRYVLPAGLLLPETTYFWRVGVKGLRGEWVYGPERSFTTAHFSFEVVPIDLSPHLNRDVVADLGDAENDGFSIRLAYCLIVGAYDGRPAARGLPEDRVVGVHRLADYSGPNALQLSQADTAPVRIEVPPGRYTCVRFLVSGDQWDSTVPLLFEYGDGGRDEAVLPCDDACDDPGDPPDAHDRETRKGSVPVWNQMDRLSGSGVRFVDRNDLALFEVVVETRSDADLVAIVLEPERGEFFHEGTACNLFSVTAVRTGPAVASK